MKSRLFDLGVRAINVELQDLGLALSTEDAEYGPHSRWVRTTEDNQTRGAYVVANGGEYNRTLVDAMVFVGPHDVAEKLAGFSAGRNISLTYCLPIEDPQHREFLNPISRIVTINRDGVESEEAFQQHLGLYRQMLLGR